VLILWYYKFVLTANKENTVRKQILFLSAISLIALSTGAQAQTGETQIEGTVDEGLSVTAPGDATGIDIRSNAINGTAVSIGDVTEAYNNLAGQYYISIQTDNVNNATSSRDGVGALADGTNYITYAIGYNISNTNDAADLTNLGEVEEAAYDEATDTNSTSTGVVDDVNDGIFYIHRDTINSSDPQNKPLEIYITNEGINAPAGTYSDTIRFTVSTY
jgi:hypothetical protein